MPAVSKKQQKFMQAVANSPKFANKVGVNQSVGQEYTKENSMKTKKMNMGGRAMNDRDGSVAMDPKMQMAMAAQQKRAAMGGMKNGGKVKKMAAGGRTARTKSIMNEKDEIRRVDREIRDKEGYMKGGKVKKMGSGGITSMGLGLAPMAAMAVKGKSKAAPVAEDPKKMKAGMKDKEGRAMAKNKKGMTTAQMNDAGGRAMMKKGGATMKAKGKGVQGYKARLDDSLGARNGKKKQSMASRRDESKGAKKAAGKKAYSGNRKSAQGKASKRADGIAQRGRTKGRMV